jgi:hypothetical protein
MGERERKGGTIALVIVMGTGLELRSVNDRATV